MNRNKGIHFSMAPQVEVRRSRFSRNSTLKTTFNAGLCVPIYLDEVLPGDTFKMDCSKVIRMSTSVHPTMDNAFLDTYFFYVPSRLLWSHWEQFNGASDHAWAQQVDYTIPYISTTGGSGTFTVDKGSLLDYLGIPTGRPISFVQSKISALPIRAYCQIWNDWFRDQNVSDIQGFDTGDSGINLSSFLVNGKGINVSGSLLPCGKFHDYFTSALPSPQKGPDVMIPTGGADVVLQTSGLNGQGVIRQVNQNGTVSNVTTGATGLGYSAGGGLLSPFSGSSVSSSNRLVYDPNGTLSVDNLNVTVNQLRLAVQTQKLFETDARCGSRYIEVLKAHFGVTSPDARLQRSEYLGGKRIPINMSQVVQSVADQTEGTPLGELGGVSHTFDTNDGFTKSFVEHGYIIGIACVRTSQTYSQGIDKLWLRRDRLDFYWPVFAHLGEQPILNQELFVSSSTADNEVFGYQEAWAEYRYKNSKLTGYMSNGTGTLNSWHYGTNFESLPSLSPGFIYQGTAEIDRTLAVSADLAHQFIADIYFSLECVRPMPVYSIPGLMDHF